MKYKVEITITTDEGCIASGTRTQVVGDGESSIGWQLGQDIADVVISLESYLTNKDFEVVFRAIDDHLEYYRKTFKV